MNVKFVSVSKTNLPNACIETDIEIRKMTLDEIEQYMQGFPSYFRQTQTARLQPFHTQSLRLINMEIRLQNRIWTQLVYPKLQNSPQSTVETTKILHQRFTELEKQIVEHNQFTMLLECIRPHQNRVARRRG